MSKFYLPTSTSDTPASTSAYTSASDSDDDEDTLPYPTELPRNDFLAADFDPERYLSSLRNRHQTLEDLRSDLRQRSQLLSKELLDLVNGDYEAFLRLGTDLRGGEERVEGVRVGVLGFGREVEGIRKGVQERLEEVGALLAERKALRKDVVLGRGLLEIEERIGELEEGMGIKELAGGEEEDELEDEDANDATRNGDATAIPFKKLQRHAQQYLLITRMIQRIGFEHPFFQAQRPRLDEIRRTLLLDLAAVLRQAQTAKSPDVILDILGTYTDLGSEDESVRVLKGG